MNGNVCSKVKKKDENRITQTNFIETAYLVIKLKLYADIKHRQNDGGLRQSRETFVGVEFCIARVGRYRC